MATYFDAYLYLANWGTRMLKLRLPASLLDPAMAGEYCYGDFFSLREKQGKVILSFMSDDEGDGDWVDGEGELDEGERSSRFLKQRDGAIAILDIGRVGLDHQGASVRIHHDLAHRPFPGPARLGRRRHERGDDLPLRIGQVASITQMLAAMLTPGAIPLLCRWMGASG